MEAGFPFREDPSLSKQIMALTYPTFFSLFNTDEQFRKGALEVAKMTQSGYIEPCERALASLCLNDISNSEDPKAALVNAQLMLGLKPEPVKEAKPRYRWVQGARVRIP